MSFAQNRVIGEVTAKSDGQITVKADNGEPVSLPVAPDTKVIRIPPGETSLAKGTALTFEDVKAGDRVLVRPGQIVVISKSDLEQKHAADRAEWQKRGNAGRIAALTDGKLMLTTAAGQTFTVTTTPKTTFRRYAPDSVKFSDAKPSSFAELKTGDQVRVLGDRNGDNIDAQIVVSGAFRNFAGTVVSVDAAGGEIKLTDLESKKPVVVKVNADSMARRMPPMMAQMLASRRSAQPDGPPVPAAIQRGPGPGAGPPRDFGQMLDRMPALNLTELKPGDALIVASTAGSDTAKATAIAIVAGVEPLLTGPAADRRLSGPWNFDINIMP